MRSSVVLIIAVGLASHAFAAGKKATRPAPKPAVSAPSTPSVAEPAPTPPPTPEPPPPAAPPPAPPPPVAEAPVRLTQEGSPPSTPSRSGLVLSAAGGVVVPFHVLGAGGRGELRGSYFLPSAPLGFSLGAGFEQHTAQGAAFLPPPRGGLDPAALDNQTLFPVQALAHVLLLRDDVNRLRLGAGYAALVTWTQTLALGVVAEELGVGHEVAGELGYARRFGALELEVIARYSVRSTAVGRTSSALELPWYQTAGVLVGLGLAP